MKIFSFLGLPGSGKGTFAKLMSQKLKLKHVSIGDLMRDEVLNQSLTHFITNLITHSIDPLLGKARFVSRQVNKTLC